jgi:hypothetical protein
MKADRANEQDVREEVAVPLLACLGYERGTSNDILREQTLSYGHVFLGRKKKSDPPLRGRADYVLAVTGAARWVLEVKAPHEEIDRDAVEQALSYARHPEVAAEYAVLLNGHRLVVYRFSQRWGDVPVLEVPVTTADDLARKVSGVLSPAAIRRDCSPPVVDTGLPLAEGFGSVAKIRGGTIAYKAFAWESNVDLPGPAVANLNEMSRRVATMRTAVTGGCVWRDDSSRIRAKLDWAVPHEELLRFANDKKLNDVEYLSLDSVVSSDPARPTVFDVVAGVNIAPGDRLFDIVRWETVMAGLAARMNYRGQGLGYMRDGAFVGEFQAEYESTFSALPGLVISMLAIGTFDLSLES